MADIVTLNEYLDLDRPNVDFLIDGLIPKPGMVLLLGEAGAGKSYMALQMALAIAQGGTFFHAKCKRGRVLYLQLDEGELALRYKLADLRDKHGIDISGHIYLLHPATAPKGINILQPHYFAILEDAIRKADPDLIVFDVLREIHNADEDSSTEMKPVGDALTKLGNGRAVLILHHPKKIAYGLDPKVVDSSRASTYLPGKVDALWLLHDGYLHIGKSRFAAGGKYRVKRLKSGLWSFD